MPVLTNLVKRGQQGRDQNETPGASSQDPKPDTPGESGRRPLRRQGLVTNLVKGVGTGIGLISESRHHNKEKKKSAADDKAQGNQYDPADGDNPSDEQEQHNREAHSGDGSQTPSDPPLYMDEATWALDDVQDGLSPTPEVVTGEQDVQALADAFVQDHKTTSTTSTLPMPMPVIIPQRRPGVRARGFVPAYAPLLQDVGIDEATFMDFIRELNKATMPSPWIHAINVAGLAAQHVPEPVTIAVGIAAQKATQVALQTHSRFKTNTFLSKLNAEYFRPLGLIAVILTWMPSRAEVITQTTLDQTIESAAQRTSGNKMQASHATAHFEWPDSAPLVFPTLDKLAGPEALEEVAKKPNFAQRSMAFATQYLDMRKQAEWAADHPESGLAQLNVKPEFHSRYSDPNHPANSGSLVALLTGGAVTGRAFARRQGRRARIQGVRDRLSAARQERGGGLGSAGPAALLGGVKKMMHEVRMHFIPQAIAFRGCRSHQGRRSAVLTW